MEKPSHLPVEIVRWTKERIIKSFQVSDDYAERLAINALESYDSHGGDFNDKMAIQKTIDVVVKSWIKEGFVK